MSEQGVLLLSGGIDSGTCLAIEDASDRPAPVCVSVHYWQRHVRELQSAAEMAEAADAEHLVLSAQMPQGSFLTGQGPDVVVPGRNLVLLTFAAAVAQQRGLHRLIIGCSAADAERFPDCRRPFLDAAASALTASLGHRIEVDSPLVDMSKRATFDRLRDLPLGALVERVAWTCYRGGAEPCGDCLSCVTRIAGDPAP